MGGTDASRVATDGDASRDDARTHMNKTTFFGLSLLIVALLVASVPELLDPTARGVERVAVSAGVIQDPQKAAAKAAADREKQATAKPTADPDKLADERLALRGFVVEEDGDLRDTVEEAERAASRRVRLEAGTSRTLLPGQPGRTGKDVPPAASEEGVLLDITGCPLFRPDTDVAQLLADPLIVDLYATKVASSDDPEACEPLLRERIATARANPVASPLGATTARDRAAIRRGGTAAMIVAMTEIQLLAEIMDDEALRASLDALAAAPAAAPAAARP